MNPYLEIEKGIWFNTMRKLLQQGNCTTIKVIGESMYPTLKDGSMVRIRWKEPRDIIVGDIIVYRHWENNATIHRVIGRTYQNGKFYFYTKGDHNPVIDEYNVQPNEIIGVVINNDSKESY